MSDSLLDRIGFRGLTEIDNDVYSALPQDYGKAVSASTVKATDYYGAGLAGSCSVTEFLSDFVVTTYSPMMPLSDYIPTVSRGSWLSELEVRKKGKPPISAVMPVCCGIKPQAIASSSGLLKYNRVSLATAIEVCDLDKWAARSSAYAVDLEAEAISDRLEAMIDVQAMVAIRGGYGLRGIVHNREFPAVYLQQSISGMQYSGEALIKTIINIIRHTDLNYTPPGGYTLALPPSAAMALDLPFSALNKDSLRSILLGTCSCSIPGYRPGMIGAIVEMPHFAGAAPGIGSEDIGLLFVPEFLSWDLSVPFQVIEPDRCGLISIGAIVSNVGEIIQKRQGHAVKIFNV